MARPWWRRSLILILNSTYGVGLLVKEYQHRALIPTRSLSTAINGYQRRHSTIRRIGGCGLRLPMNLSVNNTGCKWHRLPGQFQDHHPYYVQVGIFLGRPKTRREKVRNGYTRSRLGQFEYSVCNPPKYSHSTGRSSVVPDAGAVRYGWMYPCRSNSLKNVQVSVFCHRRASGHGL